MPSAETLHSGLTAVANDWRGLAIAWHIGLGVATVAALVGWRPSMRILGRLVTAPMLSVTAVATASGNPFNATTFALLSAGLLAIAGRMPNEPARLSSRFPVVSGGLLIGFGWIYPHFLATPSWTAYFYASPLGLLPCPTLSVAIGIALMTGLYRATPWSASLAAAGFFYGAIGVFKLGVALDYALLAGGVVLAGACCARPRRSVPFDRVSRHVLADFEATH